MTYISAALRRLVAERASHCCEYCQLPGNGEWLLSVSVSSMHLYRYWQYPDRGSADALLHLSYSDSVSKLGNVWRSAHNYPHNSDVCHWLGLHDRPTEWR